MNDTGDVMEGTVYSSSSDAFAAAMLDGYHSYIYGNRYGSIGTLLPHLARMGKTGEKWVFTSGGIGPGTVAPIIPKWYFWRSRRRVAVFRERNMYLFPRWARDRNNR